VLALWDTDTETTDTDPMVVEATFVVATVVVAETETDETTFVVALVEVACVELTEPWVVDAWVVDADAFAWLAEAPPCAPAPPLPSTMTVLPQPASRAPETIHVYDLRSSI